MSWSFKRLLNVALAFGLVCFLTVKAEAKTPTDVDIVLALDRSESISGVEALQQVEAIIYTLLHPRFHQSATNGLHGRIGLSVITWSSFTKSEVLLPWTIIGSPGDARVAAKTLFPYLNVDDAQAHGSQTDVAFGIQQGTEMHGRSPFQPIRKALNMVGDGIGNIGRVPWSDRKKAIEQGIVINALISGSERARPVLETYFKRDVIGGPTAFFMWAGDTDDFLDGMLQKFVLEIANLSPVRGQSGEAFAVSDPG